MQKKVVWDLALESYSMHTHMLLGLFSASLRVQTFIANAKLPMVMAENLVSKL